MNIEKRIESFSTLGRLLRESLDRGGGELSNKADALIERQQYINQWFTPDNVRFAMNAIAAELTSENLTRWISAYPELGENTDPFRVGLVFAGNIPLAGFHDFLSVLISGNRLIAKTSSKDPELLPFISELLIKTDEEFRDKIEFTDGTISGFDAVIATGSNNSSRFFEYYFGRYPHIIRRNRNSVAVLEGNETASELEELGKDIFTYFGLGCRSVSKLYIPAGFDPHSLTDHWKAYSDCINHPKYGNNYDFNKAIYLVNKQRFHDSGFLLMKEDLSLSSPVSVVYYEFYENKDSLDRQTDLLKDNIQCITGRNYIPFGRAQTPHLWDYADGIDTLQFLLKKKFAGNNVI